MKKLLPILFLLFSTSVFGQNLSDLDKALSGETQQAVAQKEEQRYYVPPIFNPMFVQTPQAETFPDFLRRRSGEHGTFDDLKKITGNGKGIKVGIVDTGVDKTHLKGDLSGVVKAKDFTRSRFGFYDRQGHGSHVSGHIGARKNGKGIEGIASECEIYHAKGLGDQGFGTESQLANAIDWLISEDVDIISLSLGGGYSQQIEDACKRAADAGIIVFAALGNDGNNGDGHPGNSKYTFGIAAVDYDMNIANFSSRSKMAFLSGYGVNVVSCTLNGNYAKFSGTSMATPDQAGIAALLLGYFKKVGVEIKGNADYWRAIKPSMIDLGAPKWDREYGNGFLDVWHVVKRYQTDPDDPNDPDDPDEPNDPDEPVDPPQEDPWRRDYDKIGEILIQGKKHLILREK